MMSISGDYFIVNRVHTSSGNQLACNFNGNNSAINVSNFEYLPTQVWSITIYSNMHSISPAISSELMIGIGDGGIEALNDEIYTYTWYIDEVKDVYVIMDGSLSYFWGLHDAVEGAQVTLTTGTGDETQNWWLVPASS